jgi:hypothetical protein
MNEDLPSDDVTGGTRGPLRRTLFQASLGLGALGIGLAKAAAPALIVPSIRGSPPRGAR